MIVASSVALRFAANLRQLRQCHGMSQERVGWLAGLHRTEIGKLEGGGREPRLLTIVKLAGVLEVTPDELMLGIEWLVVERDATQGLLLIDGRHQGLENKHGQ